MRRCKPVSLEEIRCRVKQIYLAFDITAPIPGVKYKVRRGGCAAYCLPMKNLLVFDQEADDLMDELEAFELIIHETAHQIDHILNDTKSRNNHNLVYRTIHNSIRAHYRLKPLYTT